MKPAPAPQRPAHLPVQGWAQAPWGRHELEEHCLCFLPRDREPRPPPSANQRPGTGSTGSLATGETGGW